MLLYSLTPSQGRLSDYVPHCLTALRQRFDHIAVTLNGPLDAAATTVLNSCIDRLLPGNTAAGIEDAYRAGFQAFGWDNLAAYDEITVMSCDLFGPIFPVDEMFTAMDAQTDLDIWGLAESAPHALLDAPTFLAQGMITFRKRLLQSPDFQTYWSAGTRIKSRESENQRAIDQARFLEENGYLSSGYLRRADFATPQPLLLEMQAAIKTKRLPFLSVTAFCRSPNYQDEQPTNLNQMLPLLKKCSDYPQRLFWQAALRKASLRTLHTNLAYQFTFDSDAYGVTPSWDSSLRIAVCAHVYYPEMLPEILERTQNIPLAYDLFITTSSAQHKTIIVARCAEAGINADVRVVGQNRGRDMSSLFIDLKDVVVDGNYDLICRLHSKKSPQVNSSTGAYFKQFIFDAVLTSREYNAHLLDFLITHPHVGMAFAPMIHTGYGTMGHAWFINRPVFDQILVDMNCDVPSEPYSPVAAYGSVYWFRPDALRPMFEKNYPYDRYDAEPLPTDGGFSHGLERAMTYVAQARGYMSATVWPDYVAAQSTTLMEYKMDSLYSHLPRRRVSPHWNLMMFMQGKNLNAGDKRKDGVLGTPNFMRAFEKRNRALLKKIGKKLGLARPRRLGN